ncbi:SelB domain-containing protein [Caloramator sp. E03]|uniref:SelB domain-containing protein n=1 Tax=Caloramator sp. E03 TaxID=2576307 RepID=UPI0026C5EC4E|nr:SelB C-terminal domain-containing protein [Caloramator sp. E03]
MDNILNTLIEDKKVYEIKISEGSVYIHKNYIEKIQKDIEMQLEEYHRLNPLKVGILKEELKTKIFGKNVKQKIYDEILIILNDSINMSENYIWKKGFEIKFDKRQEYIKNEILNIYKNAAFQPPKVEDILKGYGKEEKTAKMVFECLVDIDEIIKINEEMYLLKEKYLEAKNIAKNLIKEKGFMTTGEFRDKVGTSRKYAVALLEHFDSIKFTKRLEDKRILYR